jgi:hypothetical protein
MRRLFMLVLAAGALAVGAGTARASGFQTINPYHCPTGIGVGFGSPYTVSAAESGGLPVRLKFGWGAQQTQQLDKFLKVESGSVSLYDPAGTLVFSDAWDKTDTSGWSAYLPTQLTPNGTTFVNGFSTSRSELFGALSNPTPGTTVTYTMDMTWSLSSAVNDGLGAFGPGMIVQTANCPVNVRNYNSGP